MLRQTRAVLTFDKGTIAVFCNANPTFSAIVCKILAGQLATSCVLAERLVVVVVAVIVLYAVWSVVFFVVVFVVVVVGGTRLRFDALGSNGVSGWFVYVSERAPVL